MDGTTSVAFDPEKFLCLFMEASEPKRIGVLTEVTQYEITFGKEQQNWKRYPTDSVFKTLRGSPIL